LDSITSTASVASAWARFGLPPVPAWVAPGIRDDDAAHDAQAIHTNATAKTLIACGIAALAVVIG
jgi:hypothetical protein